jgi:hypothetical protein
MHSQASNRACTAASASPSHQPIFILAPARSYSTVTLALLAGHPDIYGFPEMMLFEAGTVGDLLDRTAASKRWAMVKDIRLSGILRAVSDMLEGSQDNPSIDRAKEWLVARSSWSPPQLMDYLLSHVYPMIGLEKCPDTSLSDDALDACLRYYPQSRYIHLTRHPATTMRSMIHYWSALTEDAESLVTTAASVWYASHLRIVRRLSQLPPERWMKIRAEDIVGDPVTWLPGVLDWLGLPYDNQVIYQMTQTQSWRFANTGQSGRLFGGDTKFMRSPVLRPVPSPADAVFDPSWGLLDEMISRMSSLARELGYG